MDPEDFSKIDMDDINSSMDKREKNEREKMDNYDIIEEK